MISQESIEELKERANLIELIGESVALRKQGSGYVGLCPFHSEKTGSFHIREAGRYYHCFGCGASGNAISYYMQTRGVPFPQAVEELAERFSVTLKFTGKKKDDKPRVDKSEYFDINRLAAAFFLQSAKTAPPSVKEYISKRGLKPETLKSFSVGFSSANWRDLTEFLRNKGFSEEKILTAGLARRNSRGELYDIFRARLIFPIFADNRKVAGFGGRIIPDLVDQETLSQMPKYLNSPDSPVYQKNRVLFGMPQAFNAIRERGFVYIVEGYMDVIGLWQAGVQNVVATCGTALSAGHVKRLGYITKRVIILFDGDSAGRAAAAKAFTTFINSGIDAKILFLPTEEDPDSIAAKMQGETASYLESLPACTLLDCHIDSIVARYSAKSIKDLGAALKGQICEEVSGLLKAVKNPVERAELTRLACFKLMVEKDLLENLSTKPAQARLAEEDEDEGEKTSPQVSYKPITQLPKIDQEILLSVMALKEPVAEKIINTHDLITELDTSTQAFITGFSQLLKDGGSRDIDQRKEQIKALLKDFGGTWLTHWKKAHNMTQDSQVNLMASFEQCMRGIRKIKLNQTLKELKTMLSGASDDTEKSLLGQRQVELQKQINAL